MPAPDLPDRSAADEGMAAPLLRVQGLARAGIAATSFTIGRGRCLAVTGPSGSGKTLLLRAIADLDPSSGDVLLAGTRRCEMPAPRWRRRVVYVAAESGWWAEAVGDHFEAPGAAGPLLRDLGLPQDALDWPVSRLSTGERQRLALARAIALEPEVLLLDEPTSGLDPTAARAAEALLRQELERGVAVVLVSHDPDQVARLADARMEMANGVLERAGTDDAGDPAP